MLGATVSAKLGVWLIIFTIITKLDWTVIGIIGAKSTPAIFLLFKYEALELIALLKLCRIATFCGVLEWNIQIIGVTNASVT